MISTIKISKVQVLDEVAKLTAYVGVKSADPATIYTQVATTPENEELLRTYWDNAVNVVADITRRYAASIKKGDDDAVELTLKLPMDFDTSQVGSLTTNLTMFCAYIIASKWFLITNAPMAEVYASEAAVALASAKSNLNARIIPQREYYGN